MELPPAPAPAQWESKKQLLFNWEVAGSNLLWVGFTLISKLSVFVITS